jgi:hypothetical protein
MALIFANRTTGSITVKHDYSPLAAMLSKVRT